MAQKGDSYSEGYYMWLGHYAEDYCLPSSKYRFEIESFYPISSRSYGNGYYKWKELGELVAEGAEMGGGRAWNTCLWNACKTKLFGGGTCAPTKSPSPSALPTKSTRPTLSPSDRPIAAPSVSLLPTSLPSVSPTEAPIAYNEVCPFKDHFQLRLKTGKYARSVKCMIYDACTAEVVVQKGLSHSDRYRTNHNLYKEDYCRSPAQFRFEIKTLFGYGLSCVGLSCG